MNLRGWAIILTAAVALLLAAAGNGLMAQATAQKTTEAERVAVKGAEECSYQASITSAPSIQTRIPSSEETRMV